MDPSITPPPAVARQGLAIASLILGILGVVCFGPLAAIPAVITGHLAYSRARRQPLEYSGSGLAVAGLVLGYVGIVIGLIILPALLLPALAKARTKSVEIRCINNLKQLSIATRLYASDHTGIFPTNLLQLTEEITTPHLLVCPADKQRLAVTTTDWAEISADNITYEYLLPGAREEDSTGEPLLRCPIHQHVIMGDGSTQKGERFR